MTSRTPGFLPANLVRKLHSYPEESVRRKMLRESLATLGDEDVLMLLGFLVCRTDADDARRAYLDLVRELIDREPWNSDRLALVEGYPAISARRPVLAFLGIEPGHALRGGGQFGPWSMEDVPLGVRKSRARTLNRDLLLVMTADPEPSVIRILLDNPRCTEVLALRVASRRPQRAGMFRELLASKFIASETFQNAIVNNPWCPTRISVAFVPLLSMNHRAEIASSGSVDEAVRLAAMAMNA